MSDIHANNTGPSDQDMALDAATQVLTGAIKFSAAEVVSYFNTTGKIETVDITSVEAIRKRLNNFDKILREELTEIYDIVDRCEDGSTEIEKIMVDIADLLADLQVYCISEMQRFGLPNDAIMLIVTCSNMSKFVVDKETGQESALFDKRGKLMKGPNYWKPEPLIGKLLALRTQVISNSTDSSDPQG